MFRVKIICMVLSVYTNVTAIQSKGMSTKFNQKELDSTVRALTKLSTMPYS